MSGKYILRLYIIGSSSSSKIALRNLQEIISDEFNTTFQLEVIDVMEHPELAEKDKILAVPSLVKNLPEPIRKIVGDLSDKGKVLLGLDLITQNMEKEETSKEV
jgi:circadian clock protein KaiB